MMIITTIIIIIAIIIIIIIFIFLCQSLLCVNVMRGDAFNRQKLISNLKWFDKS